MRASPFFNIGVLLIFLLNTCGQIPAAQADTLNLPKPGVRVGLSPAFNPAVLKGIKVHPDNPFRFDFILDQGDSKNPSSPNASIGDPEFKEQANKLLKYFLASLTTPEKDLWVNLSPYEKDRIVPESFGQTEMGRDLLAQDYLLKQITASLMYPEDDIGREFWKKIYKAAQEKYGTTEVPINTFNKVWIVPEKAIVYENSKAGTAYIVESRLKVMLEKDYLAQEKSTTSVNTINNKDAWQEEIIRDIIIPELSKEVNTGKNFAQLRQVYQSLILASWYKKKIQQSILSQVYSDKNKIAGVDIANKQEAQQIWLQYVEAFKKGAYNFIKEEADPITQSMKPRKYFSGGENFSTVSTEEVLQISEMRPDFAMMEDIQDNFRMEVNLKDAAMVNPDAYPIIDKIKAAYKSSNMTTIDLTDWLGGKENYHLKQGVLKDSFPLPNEESINQEISMMVGYNNNKIEVKIEKKDAQINITFISYKKDGSTFYSYWFWDNNKKKLIFKEKIHPTMEKLKKAYESTNSEPVDLTAWLGESNMRKGDLKQAFLLPNGKTLGYFLHIIKFKSGSDKIVAIVNKENGKVTGITFIGYIKGKEHARSEFTWDEKAGDLKDTIKKIKDAYISQQDTEEIDLTSWLSSYALKFGVIMNLFPLPNGKKVGKPVRMRLGKENFDKIKVVIKKKNREVDHIIFIGFKGNLEIARAQWIWDKKIEKFIFQEPEIHKTVKEITAAYASPLNEVKIDLTEWLGESNLKIGRVRSIIPLPNGNTLGKALNLRFGVDVDNHRTKIEMIVHKSNNIVIGMTFVSYRGEKESARSDWIWNSNQNILEYKDHEVVKRIKEAYKSSDEETIIDISELLGRSKLLYGDQDFRFPLPNGKSWRLDKTSLNVGINLTSIKCIIHKKQGKVTHLTFISYKGREENKRSIWIWSSKKGKFEESTAVAISRIKYAYLSNVEEEVDLHHLLSKFQLEFGRIPSAFPLPNGKRLEVNSNLVKANYLSSVRIIIHKDKNIVTGITFVGFKDGEEYSHAKYAWDGIRLNFMSRVLIKDVLPKLSADEQEQLDSRISDNRVQFREQLNKSIDHDFHQNVNEIKKLEGLSLGKSDKNGAIPIPIESGYEPYNFLVLGKKDSGWETIIEKATTDGPYVTLTIRCQKYGRKDIVTEFQFGRLTQQVSSLGDQTLKKDYLSVNKNLTSFNAEEITTQVESLLKEKEFGKAIWLLREQAGVNQYENMDRSYRYLLEKEEVLISQSAYQNISIQLAGKLFKLKGIPEDRVRLWIGKIMLGLQRKRYPIESNAKQNAIVMRYASYKQPLDSQLLISELNERLLDKRHIEIISYLKEKANEPIDQQRTQSIYKYIDGSIIELLRYQAGLSAKDLGLSPTTLDLIESGNKLPTQAQLKFMHTVFVQTYEKNGKLSADFVSTVLNQLFNNKEESVAQMQPITREQLLADIKEALFKTPKGFVLRVIRQAVGIHKFDFLPRGYLSQLERCRIYMRPEWRSQIEAILIDAHQEKQLLSADEIKNALSVGFASKEEVEVQYSSDELWAKDVTEHVRFVTAHASGSALTEQEQIEQRIVLLLPILNQWINNRKIEATLKSHYIEVGYQLILDTVYRLGPSARDLEETVKKVLDLELADKVKAYIKSLPTALESLDRQIGEDPEDTIEAKTVGSIRASSRYDLLDYIENASEQLDERETALGVDLISSKQKDLLAKRLNYWFNQKGLNDYIARHQLRNVGIYMVQEMGRLGIVYKQKTPLRLMIVADSITSTQRQDLMHFISSIIGEQGIEVVNQGDNSRLFLGRNGHFNLAKQFGNGFVSLLELYEVGNEALGLAQIDVLGLDDLNAKRSQAVDVLGGRLVFASSSKADQHIKQAVLPTDPLEVDELVDELVASARQQRKLNEVKSDDRAMNINRGGIDLTSDKNFEVKNAGNGIRFTSDPALLEQLKNSPGFIPEILSIQPVGNLNQFLITPADATGVLK